jgi:hypothetical protein
MKLTPHPLAVPSLSSPPYAFVAITRTSYLSFLHPKHVCCHRMPRKVQAFCVLSFISRGQDKRDCIFGAVTATKNNINFLNHLLLHLEVDGAEICLLLDPLTVLLCVRLFVQAMSAFVLICLCEPMFARYCVA